MSAPTFKVGDRVRWERGRRRLIGHVLPDPPPTGNWIKIGGSEGGRWSTWVHSGECVPCLPMSPEAKMVWHAMRAGAKRTARYHLTSMDGTYYRIRQYVCDGIYIRVDIALPSLSEDETGR